MSDLWEGEEGFGDGGPADEVVGDDEWDEGEESLETSLEDALDDPDDPEVDGADEDEV